MEKRCNDLLSKNEYITNLLTISENIGKMVVAVNEAIARFITSDTFANLVHFFQSIPTDIQETELFQRISSFEKTEITYADIEWLQESFGYMTYDMAVNAIKGKTNPTSLDTYIFTIIDSVYMNFSISAEQLYFCLTSSRWAWFDSVRNDERFVSAVEWAEALISRKDNKK